MIAQLCNYPQSYWTAYFKGMNCMLYELHLNKAVKNNLSTPPPQGVFFPFPSPIEVGPLLCTPSPGGKMAGHVKSLHVS